MKSIIVDCHCHVYPDSIAQKASDGISRFYNMPVRYDGRVSTVKTLASQAGITKAIIFSVATKPSKTSSINEFIASTAESDSGFFAGLGTLHPNSPDIRGDVSRLIELGLKGVKLHPDIQGFKLDDYRCLKIYELCEQNGLPVLVHAGDSRFDMSNPNRLQPVVEIFKNLTVIGAHLGGYSVWDEACSRLCGYDNFYVDCSSSLYAMAPHRAVEIIRSYGAGRVLFGTDFPMWNPVKEIERVRSLGLTEEELELIFFKNANRIFRLGLEQRENCTALPY